MHLGPGFTSFDITLSESVRIHGVYSNTTPPVTQPALLLLHGFPQNHLMWHKMAHQLTSSFRVIAIDLRGYGQSSKPKETEKDDKHKLYSKSEMAKDCVDVMEKLGEESFYVLAHDRGARVTHQLCINHPNKVKKAILLDICPTLAMLEATNFTFASTYWHWFFFIQPAPFPESFILSNASTFSKAVFGDISLASSSSAFHPDAVSSYTEMLKDENGVHAMLEDYRAGASIDLDEQKEDIRLGRKIKCDIRVLWGKTGLLEKMFHPIEEWKKVSEGNVTGQPINCGHYIPEEDPEAVLKHAFEFFK